MKRNLIRLIAIVLIVVNASSCSVVRIMETRAGIACTKTVGLETRRTDRLSRRDVQMASQLAGDKLNLTLQYQPYYEVEQREIVKYTPIKNDDTVVFGGALPASILPSTVLEWTAYTVELCGYTLAYRALGHSKILAVLFTVATLTDALYFAAIASEKPSITTTTWQLSSKIQAGTLEWIAGQPYQVNLPEYNFSKDYIAQSGKEEIDLSEFISSIPTPSLLTNADSISLRISTKIAGKSYERTMLISDRTGLQSFRNAVLASMGIDMTTTEEPRLMPRAEASARWLESELQAGKIAELEITIGNTGKGMLYCVVAKTTSSNQVFNNRNLEFGRISPSESRTLKLLFRTDELMQTQDIPIRVSFEEYNDYTPPDIDVELQVVGL